MKLYNAEDSKTILQPSKLWCKNNTKMSPSIDIRIDGSNFFRKCTNHRRAKYLLNNIRGNVQSENGFTNKITYFRS